MVARHVHGKPLQRRWSGRGIPPVLETPPQRGAPALERNHCFFYNMNPGILSAVGCNHDIGILPKLPVLRVEMVNILSNPNSEIDVTPNPVANCPGTSIPHVEAAPPQLAAALEPADLSLTGVLGSESAASSTGAAQIAASPLACVAPELPIHESASCIELLDAATIDVPGMPGYQAQGEVYVDPARASLHNPGNMCYLNALLHVLARTRSIRNWAVQPWAQCEQTPGHLSCAFCDLGADLRCYLVLPYDIGATHCNDV